MAEKIVFGADIDNVTIKNVNGVLTAFVDVENLEDEFEVVTDYVEPVEDDEFYVESTFAKFRHKATQLLTDAYKKEKKPRSAPVNENLVESLIAEVQYNDDSLLFEVPHEHYTSAVDGATLYGTELNTNNVSVTVNKSEYASAKAFNEAKAGKSFTITTKKRYALSEGHPVVKPTELSVMYPALPYVEDAARVEMEHSAYRVDAEISVSHLVGNNSAFSSDSKLYRDVEQAVANLDVSNIKMHYELLTSEGNTLTGEVNVDTGTYRYNPGVLSVDRSDVPDYKNNTIKHEKWSIDPIVVEGFYTKVQVTFEPYEETNNF